MTKRILYIGEVRIPKVICEDCMEHPWDEDHDAEVFCEGQRVRSEDAVCDYCDVGNNIEEED